MLEQLKNNDKIQKSFFENTINFFSNLLKKGEDDITVYKNYSDIILINEHGEILILLRSNLDDFHSGTWSLPGGKIEEGETPLEGAVRELSEETNINLDLFDLSDFKVVKKDNCTINYFIASVYSSELKIVLDAEEHQGHEWIKTSEIKNRKFILDLGEFLSDAFDITKESKVTDANPLQVVELPLMKSERIYHLEDEISKSFDANEIDEEKYFNYIQKAKELKNDFHDSIVIKKGRSGNDVELRVKDSNDSEMMREQFDDYISNSFLYKDNLYDVDGFRIPLTPDKVKQTVQQYPSIYKFEDHFENDAESNAPIMEGLPRKRFEQVLPVIESYIENYNDVQEELKTKFVAAQSDYITKVKDIKKTIKDLSEGSFNSSELYFITSYLEQQVSENIDPLIELTFGDNKRQIYLSELKNFLADIEDQYEDDVDLGVTGFEVVNLNEYDDHDLKITYFNPDDEFIIKSIHNKVKEKLDKKQKNLVDLQKSLDNNEITDDEYLDLIKSKRYELVKVVRDGKTFYQNRLIGSDVLEDLPENESFADEKTGLEVKKYSDKSILISGNTYQNIDLLRKIKADIGYGTWNKSLNGWIYPAFAKDKIFAILAEKMDVSTYEATIEQENAVAAKNALDIETPVNVEGVAAEISSFIAEKGGIQYFIDKYKTELEEAQAKKNAEDEQEKEDSKKEKGKRGRKSVPVGTISDDGKRIKTADGWDYIKTKKKEKEIGIPEATEKKAEEIINNVDESSRFKAGKELFGKEEGEESVKEKIEEKVEQIKTKAEVKTFTTRSGTEVEALDYSFVKPIDIQLVDPDKVLEERPYWCPMINEANFYGYKDGNFVFDYVKMDEDTVLLALNGFEKRASPSLPRGTISSDLRTKNTELKADIEAGLIPFHVRKSAFATNVRGENKHYIELQGKRYDYGDSEQDLRHDMEAMNNNQESNYAVVSVDQLVAIQDFYVKKRKADIELKKQADTERSIESFKRRYDVDPERYERNFYPFSYEKRLSTKQQKKYSKEEWEALSFDEKASEIGEMKYPPITIGKGNRISQLDDNTMLNSNFTMFKKYVDSEYLTPDDKGKRTYDIFDAAAIEYKEVRDLLKWKRLDLQIQREENLNSYNKGMETSYGDSNTHDDLLESHGVKIKTQNGKRMTADQKMQIDESLTQIYQSFGDRSSMAKKFGLKISHSGEKLMFARKALGLYVPSMNAIGVSNNPDHDKFGFTLAHEYAHFVDNYLGKQTGRHFASDNHNSTAGKIAYEFRKLMNKGKFTESDYANRTCECFARCMEQYHAMSTEGDDAIKSAKEGKPYHESEGHVSKSIFNSTIKPMVEKFFQENNELLKALEPDLNKGEMSNKVSENSKIHKDTKLTYLDLKNHAKETPQETLESFIKQSEDPKLRELAHKELERRLKVEHPQDPKDKIKKSEDEVVLEVAIGDASEPVQEIKKGCLMFYPTINKNKWISSVSKMIPADLCVDDGYETKPHCTVLYGFDSSLMDVEKLKILIQTYCFDKKPQLSLDNISLFENANDVVKIGVIDTNNFLTDLNQLLKQTFEYQNNFPDYKPHFTLAYVQQGAGQSFKNRSVDKEEFGIIDINQGQFVYSDHNFNKVVIFGEGDLKINKSEEEEVL